MFGHATSRLLDKPIAVSLADLAPAPCVPILPDVAADSTTNGIPDV